MAKRNIGCLILGVIWAGLTVWYYVFMFDYKHRKFSWIDSLIAISAIIVLVSCISSLSKKEDEKKGS